MIREQKMGVRIEERDRGDNTDNICQTEKSQVGQLSLTDVVISCWQKPKQKRKKPI